ncbi:hypothetical protein C9I49_25285 [Pseudomonas prosekii]|uniref:Uncharacterized protein n=1 Tax=Pseudomonas prosekii TaxID=1148509 RepID=A0A2U2D1J2_9PSED|nr:hypothetical protein C9I49_25285 [Pseudomonas prosekii]
MQDWRSTAINVGASLLAMAVGQLRLISTGTPLSRASSAPTGAVLLGGGLCSGGHAEHALCMHLLQ